MENEPPTEGRSSRRDRLMGKLFGSSSVGRERKMTNEESANEISSFLGTSDRLQVTHPPPRPPPFQNTGPPTLALDTSKAVRSQKPTHLENPNPSLQSLRARSHSPPRPRKHKGLTVRFADTYPEVMGEGGDECQAATVEIGRRKRSKSVPSSAPTKQGVQYARPGGASQDTQKGEDSFIPTPIRRTQTGFSSISDFNAQDSSTAPAPAPARAPEPPMPRTIPAGEPVRSRFLDIDSGKDENRRSFIDAHQQEQRRAEGKALAEARTASANSQHDWDEQNSSPEPIRETQPRRRDVPPPSTEDFNSSLARTKSARAPVPPPPLSESVSTMLRTQSTRSPLPPPPARRSPPQPPPARNPSVRSPLPPLPTRDPSPMRAPSTRSPLPPLPAHEALPKSDHDPIKSQRPMSPEELRINTNSVDASPSSTYTNSVHSTSDLSYRPTPITQNPASRGYFPPSPERTRSNLHEVVVAAGDDAFETFTARTKHLSELFRLYAEQLKPLETCRPDDLCRASLWWFLKGRTGLEMTIRNRPSDPDDQRHLMARYQAYTDLAKAYWLTEKALPEIAEGKYSPVDGELGEVRQAIVSNLRKLSVSMSRNGFLPPEEPFLPQTMDKSIWLEYPSLSQDITALLNGAWGSALAVVQQPTRTMDPLDALPIGDTTKHFNYTRITADVYLMEQGMDSMQTRFPCILSVVRSHNDSSLNFVVASQNRCVSLRVQSDKKAGATWQDLKWRPDASSLEIKMPRGFMLVIRCSQPEFKMLWGIYDFSTKVQSYLYPRKDEIMTHSIALRAFHYFDSNPQSRAFPKEAVGQCQLGLFERLLKENSPTGTRTFHRGFRVAVVTGPRIRTLSGVTHFFAPQLPVQFALLRGDQRAPLLQLDFNDGKDKGRMVLSFNDDKEREKMLRLLSGSYVQQDEEVVADVPLEGMNMSEGLADTKGGFAAIQRLPWQRARIINDKYLENPPTVLAEKLRVEIDSMDKSGVGVVSTITDRVNVGPGELRLRLGTRDILTLQVMRQAQLDMTVSLLETSVPRDSYREFASLQNTIQRGQTLRTYRFPSFKDLHAFQAGLTGYTILFDGIASSMNISRRRMVVPIHKKWEAGTTRVQVVQREKTVQLLAFFEEWHHGECMGFALKGTDVFEAFSRNGKAGLKLADAKFPLPRVPAEGAPKTDDMAFISLDMPEFAGEHDDLTILFDDNMERDRLCAVLPAPVKGSRLSRGK
ncbi:Uu.00g037700.m01.CDS01 [Anthostomella pinea]|uniref:Uu.00g037700.m01.CDS01 n=1 Tax=Anthostomella pinea TaxID=933095 RepID=A0AAI8VA63_9PEZI|nr:Uu.00g037700.m01.CDS01 [Anthostomella pinea]